ncbi:MAG: hypothetical protein K2J37_01235 [Ruminococcus sp.]|nr:hypothetical protein [Ruminococcus sp.]
MISPDSDNEGRKTISQTVAETTSANDDVEKLTTTETKVKETTTTKVKTTTQTTTVTTTTTTVPVTTEPPTEPPTEAPTPAPTEPPYVPPVQSNEPDYVLNTSRMKAHYPDCRDVNKIDNENRQDYYGTAEDLQSMGYSACGHCHTW